MEDRMRMFAEAPVTVRDPVCGMVLELAHASGRSVGSHTWYFCSTFCRSRFDTQTSTPAILPLIERRGMSGRDRKKLAKPSGSLASAFDRRNVLIASGWILEAFETFYADNVVVTWADGTSISGKRANREREHEVVSGLRSFSAKRLASAVHEASGRSSAMWIVTIDHERHGRVTKALQTAQRWENNQIVEETMNAM
jgi:YHS domain-containing protein